MSEIDVSYEDGKNPQFIFKCGNLMSPLNRKVDDIVELNLFQVYVEVPVENGIDDEKKTVGQIQKQVNSLTKSLLKEVDEMVDRLRKLQKEEEQGNKKAASEAEKLVSTTEKRVKKWAGEFGGMARRAVQEAIGSRENLRSISRTIFRGMELNEEAFEGSDEGEAPGFMVDLAKSLATTGKEVFKLTTQEKDLRKDLSLEIEKVHAVIEKAEAGKKDFDFKAFYKANSKDCRALESLAAKYIEFLNGLSEKLEDAATKHEKLDKLIDKNEKLDDDKQLDALCKDYSDAMKTVRDSLKEKSSLADQAKRLFKDNYDSYSWSELSNALAQAKGATKSGKSMQDAGADLEKFLKG